MLTHLWILAMLTLSIAAICGIGGCGIGLVVVFVVGEALLPMPPGPRKYP